MKYSWIRAPVKNSLEIWAPCLNIIIKFKKKKKKNVNTYENEEVAFIGQRSGEPLKWRQLDEISKDTILKIKYTALLQNFMKLG